MPNSKRKDPRQEWLQIRDLDSHPLNPNEITEEYFKKLKKNIQRSGQYPAIIVREKGNGRYEIIDGHMRTRVLEDMGKDIARCEIWDVDDKEARLLIATLNRLRGVDDSKKRAALLASLSGEFDVDLMDLIPETGRSLDALLKTVEADTLQSDISAERGVIEDQLIRSGVDPEKAEQMASLHRPPSDKMIISFPFKDEIEYNKAKKFFMGKNKTVALMEMINAKNTAPQ